MPHAFWISQLFGSLALLFDVIKFTRTKRSALILWGIPAGWSMVASQYFLGQAQGAVFQAMASLESILQTITGQDSRGHRRRRVAIALIFGSLGFWIYAPTAVWWTWFPVGTYIFSSLGKLFYRPWLIRMVWLASSSFITAYSVICGNWSIVLQQMVVISLSIFFLWRALLEHRKNVCAAEVI
ncbi:YgjV family protein [Acidithiobacillus thiooxidans]|uniref:YgjV family protein n=1 Tax=Acidithiobacillus thiooxidans TaxID=930 RepID=UPI0004E1D123|nr:YgjV family protein [Acidithiobacillus thiooxidans]